jgi:hypothetical protein
LNKKSKAQRTERERRKEEEEEEPEGLTVHWIADVESEGVGTMDHRDLDYHLRRRRNPQLQRGGWMTLHPSPNRESGVQRGVAPLQRSLWKKEAQSMRTWRNASFGSKWAD